METKRSGLKEGHSQGEGQAVRRSLLNATPLNVEFWDIPQTHPLNSKTLTTKVAPWRDEERVVLSIRRPDGSELISVYATPE